MLHHLVLIHVAEGTADEAIDALVEALRALPPLIPSIRTYDAGRDAGIFDGNAAVGVTATFDDEAGLRAYIDHPEHQRVVQELITPIRKSREAIQFEVP